MRRRLRCICGGVIGIFLGFLGLGGRAGVRLIRLRSAVRILLGLFGFAGGTAIGLVGGLRGLVGRGARSGVPREKEQSGDQRGKNRLTEKTHDGLDPFARTSSAVQPPGVGTGRGVPVSGFAGSSEVPSRGRGWIGRIMEEKNGEVKKAKDAA